MIVDNALGSSRTGPVELPAPRDTLAAWLPLEAREATSPWRAYLDVLPAELPELPLVRPAEELEALAGTAAHTLADEVARDVRATYEQLPRELRTRVSLADFTWGRAIVMSRGFHAPGTFDHRIALLPLVDIFNHGRSNTTWTYGPLEGMVVSAECAIACGEEVFFSYGQRSNSYLLVHYGFVLDDNPVREAQLELEGGNPALIGSVFDDRFAHALALARRDGTEDAALETLVAAALRTREKLDAGARVPRTAWERICAEVRGNERAVVDQLLDFVALARNFAHSSAKERRAAVAAMPADVAGARGVLRRYLEELLADEA